jgi:hypothetical protein
MKNVQFIIFLLVTFSVFSQTDSLVVKNDKSNIVQKKIETKNLTAYKSDSDFNYDEAISEKPSLIVRFFSWLGRLLKNVLEWIFGVKYAQDIFAVILAVIPYLIAGLVVFLLLKFFLKVNSKSIIETSKNIPTVTITEEEELIKTKDISKLIEKAIEQKNYRLAVRYYYIFLLKQLEQQQYINWEQQKTNDDYSHEITNSTIKNAFIKLTHLYDFVWYGNFSINEMEFKKVETNFIKMNQLILKK